MEEKRRDTGTLPPASSSAATATVVTTKSTEPASAEPASIRRRAGGQKRKANNGGNASSTPSKRLAREKASASLPPIHNGPCTRARQSPNNLGAASGSVASGAAFSAAVSQKPVELFAQSQSAAGGVVVAAEESKAASEDWQALEAGVEAEYEVIRSRDANAHVVPIPSGWFSWAKVHPLEERALPSFFTGKSENRTADIYMEIRNWIMKKFHANPNTPIELKDLSELSVGELDARQEVMEFLDYWGLINFHPFPSTDSDAANADSDGAAKTDPLVEKLYRFETVHSCPPVVPKTNLATPALPSRLFPESSIAEELVRPEGPAVEYHCNSCSADCSRKRYHCQKQADFDLCTECFNNGKFGSDMSPSDFILMEPAEVPGVSGGKWTDQETLLLLEALELYKENWNEIAEHVATKTKAQCILHFVQMPIEDMFLDHDNEIDASLQENADPVSTNNDLSVPKDAPETTESKTGASEESKTGASEESKTGASEEKPMSSPMETSKPEDASEQKISQVTGENYALKALNEAFEVVGSLPTPGSQLSFAEVGNPVMALAAFLVRLVEADIASASTHSSLKSISGNSPGMRLAARHCFVLDHPPDEKKEPAGSERAVADMVDRDAQKDENQKEEISVSVLDGSVLNDQSDKIVEESVLEEKEVLVSPNGECSDKSHAPKEPDAIATHEEVEPGILNEPNNPDLPKDLPPSIVKESDDLTSKAELSPSSAKESGNGTSEEVPAQCTEAPKDVDMVSDSLTEKKEPEQPVTSNSVVENEPNSGEDDTKDCKEENHDCTETNDNRHIDKIKRAAITAISAAAVKAKLLANQEEGQIRQLATLLIEKQLHKMETKLAFFTEMESVVMRVREQMDRSRQKLYHERAQIIATRLGFPASSSRAMPPSMPINRVATNFANSAPKPPMSMTSQRSPISRPIMTSALPTSNPFVSATVTGSSIRPSSQDKLSSVGMK